MELKDIRVFVCVPAVGKTYLSKISNRFVDMDKLKAAYKYGEDYNDDENIEKNKGNRTNPLRHDATKYIAMMTKKYLEETDKILLFAPNPQIVQMIYENNIPYCLVFHSKDCIDEIEQRMRSRGNQENFIRAMVDPIDEFYSASINDTRPAFKIELHRGEYLSDKLLPLIKEKEKI